MCPATEKVDLSTTQSDLIVLQEKGFILEKIIGEGSYAKVRNIQIHRFELQGRPKRILKLT